MKRERRERRETKGKEEGEESEESSIEVQMMAATALDDQHLSSVFLFFFLFQPRGTRN